MANVRVDTSINLTLAKVQLLFCLTIHYILSETFAQESFSKAIKHKGLKQSALHKRDSLVTFGSSTFLPFIVWLNVKTNNMCVMIHKLLIILIPSGQTILYNVCIGHNA